VAIGRSPLARKADGEGPHHAVAIRGLRRTLRIDRARLSALLKATLADEGAPPGQLLLALVSDRTMRRINRDYRGIDATTDVLSFSYVGEPHAAGVLGEVFVSPRVAARQARETGCRVPEEVARLSVHGTLHVLGWDHDTSAKRRRMLGRQERYVDRYFRKA
jgi:probable rRNA maturation factor